MRIQGALMSDRAMNPSYAKRGQNEGGIGNCSSGAGYSIMGRADEKRVCLGCKLQMSLHNAKRPGVAGWESKFLLAVSIFLPMPRDGSVQELPPHADGVVATRHEKSGDGLV
jgi:hypothetical protein